jgi:hypothetical protein
VSSWTTIKAVRHSRQAVERRIHKNRSLVRR